MLSRGMSLLHVSSEVPSCKFLCTSRPVTFVLVLAGMDPLVSFEVTSSCQPLTAFTTLVRLPAGMTHLVFFEVTLLWKRLCTSRHELFRNWVGNT